MLLPLFLLQLDDRFGPPSLIEGPSFTGEDAEKDKRVPPASPQLSTLAIAPKAEGSSSFTPPNVYTKEEAKVLAVESTDGATAGSKHNITCVTRVKGL